MSIRPLSSHPNLRHLKLQAKALRNAACHGDVEAISRLVRHGIATNRRPTTAQAQLAIAREYGFDSWTKLKIHVELAARTFQEKLDAFLESAWLWGDTHRARSLLADTPELVEANLIAAVLAGSPQSVAKFLSGDAYEVRQLVKQNAPPRRWPPLLYAAWSCFLSDREADFCEVFRMLLDHGADPNCYWWQARWSAKETALYGTIEANCAAAARVLLDAGADPNDGESLYHACEHFNLELLHALGEHELKPADISYCIKHAMDYRWDEGIQWFLDQGADPNATHPQANETSLHWAVKRACSLETIDHLLRCGADPNAKTKSGHSAYRITNGQTPLDFALRLGQVDVAQRLRDAGAVEPVRSPIESFLFAAAAGREEIARGVLSQNPRLMSQLTHDDHQLVAHVAQMENWHGVQLMVELGWPLDIVGWMDAKPLTWAICFGSASTVKFLLERGATTTSSGGYFQTPLHTVLHCRWKGRKTSSDYPRVLEHLLEHGVMIPEGTQPTGVPELDEILARSR